MRRIITLALAALVLFMGAATHYRFELAFALLSADSPPPLLDKRELTKTERWFDDYYTIDQIDAQTYAIGEPRASGPVFSYLIIGTHQALLFDVGYPSADILPVVTSLTDKPILAVPSHLHFDHVGNLGRFDQIALLDTPQRRSQTDEDVFTPTQMQFLGASEGHALPSWKITRWLTIGEDIEIGDRTMKVVFTPGHTDESISLWDKRNNQFFSGDFIYEGALYAFLPNSSLGDYLKTSEALLLMLPKETQLYTAHRWRRLGTPILQMNDLVDLRDALERIRAGDVPAQGFFPSRYPINENLDLDADLPWYQKWGR